MTKNIMELQVTPPRPSSIWPQQDKHPVTQRSLADLALSLMGIRSNAGPVSFSEQTIILGVNSGNELTVWRVRNDNRGRGYAAYIYRTGVEWDMTYATR